jgi:hypothetical protein
MRYLPSSSDDFFSRLVVGRNFKVSIMCNFENRKVKSAIHDQVFISVWYHFDRRLTSPLFIVLTYRWPWFHCWYQYGTHQLLTSLILVAVQSIKCRSVATWSLYLFRFGTTLTGDWHHHYL